MAGATITAIVLTLDEARHLPGCLASLSPLTRDILVVDSGSTDRTQDIARESGAAVIERTFTGFASQRNAALDMASGDWVLFLDADERLTPELVSEIRESIDSADGAIAGFRVPRENLVCGRALRGGGWWPDHQARIICNGRGRFDPEREVHEVVVFDGPDACLTQPMIHINYESWHEVLERQRAYTVRQVRVGQVPSPRRLSYVSRPVREFLRRFVRLRGYRDGTTGLRLALIMGLEELRGCLLMRATGRT